MKTESKVLVGTMLVGGAVAAYFALRPQDEEAVGEGGSLGGSDSPLQGAGYGSGTPSEDFYQAEDTSGREGSGDQDQRVPLPDGGMTPDPDYDPNRTPDDAKRKWTDTAAKVIGVPLSFISSYGTAVGKVIATGDKGAVEASENIFRRIWRQGLSDIPFGGTKIAAYVTESSVSKSILSKSTKYAAKVGASAIPFVGVAAGAELQSRFNNTPRWFSYPTEIVGDIAGAGVSIITAPLALTGAGAVVPIAGNVATQVGVTSSLYWAYDKIRGASDLPIVGQGEYTKFEDSKLAQAMAGSVVTNPSMEKQPVLYSSEKVQPKKNPLQMAYAGVSTGVSRLQSKFSQKQPKTAAQDSASKIQESRNSKRSSRVSTQSKVSTKKQNTKNKLAKAMGVKSNKLTRRIFGY
jgi:hypothetical protein